VLNKPRTIQHKFS